jgi:hypothetical protein
MGWGALKTSSDATNNVFYQLDSNIEDNLGARFSLAKFTFLRLPGLTFETHAA